MRKMKTVSSAFAGLLFWASTAIADGDAASGLEYAKDACSDCHAITAAAKVSPNMKAPPFAVIAKSNLVTTRELVAWLQSSHPDMPDLTLTPATRDNLIAYIKSLAIQK